MTLPRIALFLGAAMVGLWSVPGGLRAESPLLFDGTRTIFERVLTKPGQALYDAPNGKKVRDLWPLQPVYVYARKDGWIQVGRSEREGEGWITEADTATWVHNIVGAFTARGTERPRQIFFDTETKLQSLLDHESFLDLAARYRDAAGNGDKVTDSGLLTIEKEEFVDISNSFYLMPITRFRERKLGYGALDTLHLEVASVPLDLVTNQADDAPFRIGIVFVVDTTQSMKPFIPETLSVVREIVAQLSEQHREDDISFGLIGFRDDPTGRPGTEYRVREFVPLDHKAPQNAILDGLANMKAMEKASTWGYPEDSLSGLKYAIDTPPWTGPLVDFAGRMVILITDAPPKAQSDPHADSRLSPESIAKIAAAKGVGISTIHLLSRSGRDYNDAAEEAYRALSRFRNLPDEMYFPVDARDSDAFRARIRAVVGQVVGSISKDIKLTEKEGDSEEVAVGNIGIAMRLAYLGRITGQDAPPILRGWTLDRSFEAQREFAIEPRVLVTRNQLLTMSEIMAGIVRKADESTRQGREDLFFENVRDVVAGIGADGSRLVNEGADNLGSMIGEFMEYMPYVSKNRIMTVTENEWINNIGLQYDITNELKDKLELYESLYNSRELWTPLYEGQDDGEHVYAMPLEALP